MDGFTALADPTRREIVDLLADGEKDAGTIAANFSVSKPAISRHLANLRAGGIVTVRRDAQRRLYSLSPDGLAAIDRWLSRYRSDGLAAIDRWLSRYRSFWSDRLDDLEAALEEGT